MAKGRISVASLFDQQHHLAKATRDVLSPRDAGVAKAQRPKQSIFSKFGKPKKPAARPAYESFAEVSANYRKYAGASNGRQLDPVYNALIARVDGLQVNGKPLKTSGAADVSQIEELIQQHEALSKSLDEDVMTLQQTSTNGTVGTREVKFGVTMRAFDREAEQKGTELVNLMQRLEDVAIEIAAARNDLVAIENKAVKKAKRAFESELASLFKEVETVKKQAHEDVKQAKADDQAYREKVEAKLDERFFLVNIEFSEDLGCVEEVLVLKDPTL